MSTNGRSASRNSEMEVNRTSSRVAGDTSARRILSARGESSKTQGHDSTNSTARASHSAADHEDFEAGASGSAASRSSSRISLGSRSRSNLSQASSRSGMVTPTKRVSLTAVQRKQEKDDLPFEPELDWREFTRTNSSLTFDGLPRSNSFQLSQDKEDTKSNHLENAAASCSQAESQALSNDHERSEDDAEVTAKMAAAAITEGDNPQGGAEAKEESSTDEEDSDEEPRKAPNELLMEFLDCVMKKEFETAEKLCRMILIYEPDNKEALTFHPIIMEKLQLDQEAAEAEKEGNADDDEDDDDDEEDNDDDDDEDGDEDSSSQTDTSNDEDGDDNNNSDEPNREGAIPPRPDSGIGL